MPGGIFSTGVDGTRVVLQRHGATGGKEIIGVVQATDGNNTEEFSGDPAVIAAAMKAVDEALLDNDDTQQPTTQPSVKRTQRGSHSQQSAPASSPSRDAIRTTESKDSAETTVSKNKARKREFNKQLRIKRKALKKLSKEKKTQQEQIVGMQRAF